VGRIFTIDSSQERMNFRLDPVRSWSTQIASIHENAADRGVLQFFPMYAGLKIAICISLAIYKGPPAASAKSTVVGEEGQGSHVESVDLNQPVLGIMLRVGDEVEGEVQAHATQSTGKAIPNSPVWTRRY
jgi:hypothetical protein